MQATLTNKNRIYKLELANGCKYWSKPGETHADFLLRVKDAVYSDHKIWLSTIDFKDFTRFSDARYDALHKISFINHELGRMGRDEGQKQIHKAALNKIIRIIDLYNNEEWQTIAGITL